MDDPYGASTYYGHFDILQLQDVGGQSVFFFNWALRESNIGCPEQPATEKV